MKLVKLGAARPVVLHNDEAFETSMPREEPAELAEDVSDEQRAEHVRALERFAAWMRYQDTYDLKWLTPFMRPGHKPVVFMVAALPAEAHAVLVDIKELGLRCLHAVRYGVTDILDLEFVDEEGGGGIWKVKREEGEYGRALDDATLRLFLDHAVLIEVATHVFAASKLPRGLLKSH